MQLTTFSTSSPGDAWRYAGIGNNRWHPPFCIMKRKEDLLEYDFQGWPIFRMNFREILIALGAKEEDGKYTFDASSPTMDLYPQVLMDDGMGYGVDESYVCQAFIAPDKKYINFFRSAVPDKENSKQLIKKWEEDEREIETLRANKSK